MGPVWQLIDSSSVGGIERHIEMLTRGLRRIGVECQVVLYANHGKNPWFEQLKAANIPYRVLKGTVGDLTRAMRTAAPSLVHTHGYKAGILGRAVARLTGTPVVSTYHQGELGPFPVSVYQKVDEYSSFLAPAIAVSDRIRENLPVKAELVYNFIDMPEKETDPTRTRLRAGFVGRFNHEKAPDHFCALVDMVHMAPAFERVEWHTYGEGTMHEELEKIHDGHINFHGVQTDMSLVWPNLDLLLMPSRAEGLPLAALEALSHGIPVIAPKLGALPDVISHGENGWLFEPGNLDEAADYLMEWADLDADKRKRIFQKSRQHVAENFSVQSRLKVMLDIYSRSGFKHAA